GGGEGAEGGEEGRGRGEGGGARERGDAVREGPLVLEAVGIARRGEGEDDDGRIHRRQRARRTGQRLDVGACPVLHARWSARRARRLGRIEAGQGNPHTPGRQSG